MIALFNPSANPLGILDFSCKACYITGGCGARDTP